MENLDQMNPGSMENAPFSVWYDKCREREIPLSRPLIRWAVANNKPLTKAETKEWEHMKKAGYEK